MRPALAVSAVDYHTGGEPFRIVSGGVKPLRGRRILDKRRYAAEHLDEVRRLLVFEPRGHADMYGGFVTEPEDDGADLGVVFFHNAGYSTACGHGTIALVTWALDSGLLPMEEPETAVTVDAPSGRLPTVARIEGGRVVSVRFRNVPSFVLAEGLVIETSRGPVTAGLSYGGAFYASVRADEIGLSVHADDLHHLIAVGREVKRAIESQRAVVHPLEPELGDVYGVIFFEDVTGHGVAQRNVAIFADGEVDRSPCGSGTSARLA
ncbi:MAG: proline racemase family protein, partial [Planctomycetaceae bacterium]